MIPITLYYVTDPICSHCWTIEPVLRRFVEQYGDYFELATIMGGLLEKWHDGPIDPANGIYQPTDVAGHWREVGYAARMPIDGSLMLTNPVQSSYPPSRVFKVIQKRHGSAAAQQYLRKAREALFVFNQNISDSAVLVEIVNRLDLAGQVIVAEAESHEGQKLLNEDLALAESLGARVFPTIIMLDYNKNGVRVAGGRPLDTYVAGLQKLSGPKELEPKPLPTLTRLLQREKLLFSKEIEVMYSLQKQAVSKFVEQELTAGSYIVQEFLGEQFYQYAE